MLNLKKLGAAVLLTCVLGLTAWADCPNPGIIGSPPCVSAAQTAPDDSTAPGQIEGPPAPDAPSVELPSLTEIALNVLMLF